MNKVLIIGHQWPEPSSSAAGWRMNALISFFIEEAYAVHFASATVKGAHVALPDGVETHAIQMNDSSFDRWVEALDPTIVMFDRFMVEEQFGWRVTDACPKAIRILDSEDLHCLRKARQVAVKQGRDVQTSDLCSDTALREIAAIYRCDLSLIISTHEMDLLTNFYNVSEHLLVYLPFFSIGIKEAPPSYGRRQHFMSIGNFLHAPNRDAVEVLNKDIWPLIRAKLPDAEMHVYGAYADEKAKQMHNEANGFFIKGRAESSVQAISAGRVMLAPLRFGAGLKGKLIEAMECQTPSVTTSIGAEGMHAGLPWPGAVHDDYTAFANAAVELHENQATWEAAQAMAELILTQCFDTEVHKTTLRNRLEEVCTGLSEHREKNFTGAMLQHHTARSTEFMSRWIELKNTK